MDDLRSLLREGAVQAQRLRREVAGGARLESGWPSRRGNTRKHGYKGAIINVRVRDGKTEELHATKGWRRVGELGWSR